MELLYSDRTFVAYSHKVFYFRVCGYGLWVGNHKTHPPLFSERYGYVKVWHPFGQFCIRALTPRPEKEHLYG